MRAMSAAAAETPPKPKIAAMMEITKNIKAHFNSVMAASLGALK
jgi:hypothetical protein